MASKISSGCCPVAWALACARLVRRAVCVAPGSTLFTVMPNGATSVAQVLAQFATAPRTVLDTPRPASGALTDVLITLTTLPQPAFFIPGNTAWVKMWLFVRCC